MRRWIVPVVILVAIGIAAAAGWWYLSREPDRYQLIRDELDTAASDLGLEPADVPLGIVVSGFVEADEAAVTTELGGRIVSLHADEGDEVTEGQILACLDDSLIRAQREQAEAAVGVAEANLRMIAADAREEAVGYAQAMVRQAQAAEAAARVVWEDAVLFAENPQELDLAITSTRGELAVQRLQEKQAEALANSAQAAREFSDESVKLMEEMDGTNMRIRYGGMVFKEKIKIPPATLGTAREEQGTVTYLSWEAWTGVDQAEAAAKGTRRYLAELLEQRENPVVLEAQVNAAASQMEVATTAVEIAQAQVDGLQMGATAEQVAAVEAQVQIARSALQALDVMLDQLTLSAPISGLVLDRPRNVGEVALPGVPLMTIADLDNVTLTVYVPEDQLGHVSVGQAVSVTVDAYPERTFRGAVSQIASQAEFTPKNVQTREERVNMVFAVKVKLANPDHALKPGMPADAILQELTGSD